MPISLHVTAETAAEYREAMQVLAGFVQAATAPKEEPDANAAWRHLPPDPIAAGMDELDRDIPAGAVEDVTGAMADAADKPRARRGRPRKAAQEPSQEAQNEIEAAQPEPDAAQEAQNEIEAAQPEPEAAPAAQDDLFEAPAAPAVDPAADKAAALDLLRSLYDRPGMASKINEVLASYNVGKFTMIPAERGTELLATARELDASNPA